MVTGALYVKSLRKIWVGSWLEITRWGENSILWTMYFKLWRGGSAFHAQIYWHYDGCDSASARQDDWDYSFPAAPGLIFFRFIGWSDLILKKLFSGNIDDTISPCWATKGSWSGVCRVSSARFDKYIDGQFGIVAQISWFSPDFLFVDVLRSRDRWPFWTSWG